MTSHSSTSPSNRRRHSTSSSDSSSLPDRADDKFGAAATSLAQALKDHFDVTRDFKRFLTFREAISALELLEKIESGKIQIRDATTLVEQLDEKDERDSVDVPMLKTILSFLSDQTKDLNDFILQCREITHRGAGESPLARFKAAVRAVIFTRTSAPKIMDEADLLSLSDEEVDRRGLESPSDVLLYLHSIYDAYHLERQPSSS